MAITAPQPLRSYGRYLTLSDAVEIVGKACIEGWRKNDRNAFNESSAQRYRDAIHRLKYWLTGNEILAWTTDDEGAWAAIDVTRTSKPYFDIDVANSLFKWAPDEWATMMIDLRSLTALTNGIKKAKPRTNTFRWRVVSAIAWKVALNMPHPRHRQELLNNILLQCGEELNFEPDEKELGFVVDDILRHLDGYELSKVV